LNDIKKSVPFFSKFLIHFSEDFSIHFVKREMGLLLPFGLLLANAAASDFGELQNIRLLNETYDFELAPHKYIDLVMDYLNTLPPEVEGPYGPLVFDSTTLRCAENSLQGLPKLAANNSRENVYQHMMGGLFLLRDENALDAIR